MSWLEIGLSGLTLILFLIVVILISLRENYKAKLYENGKLIEYLIEENKSSPSVMYGVVVNQKIEELHNEITRLNGELKYEKRKMFSVQLEELIKQNAILTEENVQLYKGIDRFKKDLETQKYQVNQLTEINNELNTYIERKENKSANQAILEYLCEKSKTNESTCKDAGPKKEKTLCGEDLLDNYENKKDVVQMFRYFTGYGNDIKILMDYLGCQAHELDLDEGWMTFKRLMDNTEFKVNNGDCIVVINHKDISVMTYRDFTSKYTKKES